MKCETCDGKGFQEFEAGVIMLSCPDCHGTGEVDGSPDILPQVAQVSQEKKEAFEGLVEEAHRIIEVTKDPDSCYVLPSKNVVLRKNEPVIPLNQMGGMVSERELTIVSRIEPDNRPTGSENPSKPKQPKKQKAKSKAAKGHS